MRNLAEEEWASLRLFDQELATADLVYMANDLAEILLGRGHIIQARLVEVIAARLDDLDGRGSVDPTTGRAGIR